MTTVAVKHKELYHNMAAEVTRVLETKVEVEIKQGPAKGNKRKYDPACLTTAVAAAAAPVAAAPAGPSDRDESSECKKQKKQEAAALFFAKAMKA